MAYKAKFLHFKTKQSYNTERNKTVEGTDERKVFDAYISFIDEGPTICTWGKEYKCSIDEARINEILEEKGVGEKEVEIISVPSEAIKGTTYEFTSQELYNQLDDAITNNRIIVAHSTDVLGGSNNSVMIVFSQAIKLETGILLSGVMAPSISSNHVNLFSIVLGIESTGSCTITTSNINPESTTPRPNSGYGSAGTSLNYSRGDHVHPAQTSVTGNAGTATKLQTARNINLTGNVTGSASFDGSDNISINTTVGNIDASKITSGTLNADRLPEIPLEKLPAGALERLVIVENQAARYQLTTSDVQEGDTVKQNDTGVMYFVVDTDNLANENGYKVYTAGAATSVPWSGVTGKPSTLEDYGVSATDPYLAKPTTFNWTGGTTAGPIGKLTGTNTDVSFPAIPVASKTASGVITTEDQEFSGNKTFDGVVNAASIHTTNVNPLNEDENLYIGYNVGAGTIYIGADGDYNFGNGGEYTGNAATATKVNNKLTFTGAVTGEYDGSSALTVNIPEGGSGGEVPIALPNPYPIKFTGAVTAEYDGSSNITVNIPKTTMTYSQYSYNATSIGTSTSIGIEPNHVYIPTSLTATTTSDLTIYVKVNAFNANTPNAIVAVAGTRKVNFSLTTANGFLAQQSNILKTGSSSTSYRVYAFTYLGGSGSMATMAVNCAEYEIA